MEVFCGSLYRNISEVINGINIHRCLTKDPYTFQKDCLGIFEQRHLLKKFDIIESPEIHGNVIEIKKKFPELPLIIRLHMPLFIQMRLNNFYTTRLTKLRFFLGGLRRGKINFLGHYNYKKDVDYNITAIADGVVSPSEAMKEIIIKEWKISFDKIIVIPNPYVPSQVLLNINNKSLQKNRILFIGKLNVHKGIVNLVKVIPFVVKKYPDVVFILVGNDSYFATKKMNMSAYVQQQLKGYEKNYTITGGLEYAEVVRQLTDCSLCIFPSIWECFGMVCLEAMSAGRPIIGSSRGGMSDILTNAGELADPHNVMQMANDVIKLLGDHKLREYYAKKGREKVLSEYSPEIIGRQIEEYYQEVINKNSSVF
ncbi:hypothetical protein BH09BAC2_BH09BAC2_15830 [soil metagenome]